MSDAILYVIGSPLAEGQALPPHAVEILQSCDLVIGETRPVLDRYLKHHDVKGERFHLDPPRRDEQELLNEGLERIAKTGGKAALLSDVGMPILFDPGSSVLETCRRLGLSIRTVPGPTSWATACSVSGWAPPFLIYGFLDRDAKIRESELRRLMRSPENIVLMETPYRFLRLLADLQKHLGPKHQLFLAWEISKKDESYFWGTITEVLRYAEKKNYEKGEFVLLLKAPTSVK